MTEEEAKELVYQIKVAYGYTLAAEVVPPTNFLGYTVMCRNTRTGEGRTITTMSGARTMVDFTRFTK